MNVYSKLMEGTLLDNLYGSVIYRLWDYFSRGSLKILWKNLEFLGKILFGFKGNVRIMILKTH